MKIFSEVLRLPQFERDMKRLLKRYRTLESDLQICIGNQLKLYHKLGKETGGTVQISHLDIETPKIYKVLKFACRSLKGKGGESGIRLIYGYYDKEDKVVLIEIYYKGDKENEDRDRIVKHFG
jgi:mRNA-degrading endonuclease RelE of RelBE toxin-antitoxin system